jgi:hypothetical protein
MAQKKAAKVKKKAPPKVKQVKAKKPAPTVTAKAKAKAGPTAKAVAATKPPIAKGAPARPTAEVLKSKGAAAKIAAATLARPEPKRPAFIDEDLSKEGEFDAEFDDQVEEDETEEVEGLPPWWKDSPSGIEGTEEEGAEERANFDDSDEWTEDDEEWGNKKTSLEEVEGSDDEDDNNRW